MNIYDKKIIKCKICGKSIGEIDYNATIYLPRCNDCAEPLPHIKDKFVREYEIPNHEIEVILTS